jgi:hypothetical protein
MTSDPHFLVVAGHNGTQDLYSKKLDSLAVRYSIVESPKELHFSPQNNTFHGLLIDVHNFVRLSVECKGIVRDYSQVLPTMKVFHRNNNFVVNYSSFESEKVRGIDDFVEKCSRMSPRIVRRNQRYNIYLNIMIDGRKCVVTDISRCGCFIIGADLPFAPGEYVNITVNELMDDTPISVLVRRNIQWGTNYMVPGLGAEFITMSAGQRNTLEQILTQHAEKIAQTDRLFPKIEPVADNQV